MESADVCDADAGHRAARRRADRRDVQPVSCRARRRSAQQRLAAYLGRARARVACCSSARPPATAARASRGIPFTSERQLTGCGPGRGERDDRPPRARGARARGEVLLWNVVPTHPHGPAPGRTGAPTRAEVEAVRPLPRSCRARPPRARRRPARRGGARGARTSATRATGAPTVSQGLARLL